MSLLLNLSSLVAAKDLEILGFCRRALSATDQTFYSVGRLCAFLNPGVHLVHIQYQFLVLAPRRRIVSSNDFNELARCGLPAVGNSYAVHGIMLFTKSSQSNYNHREKSPL